MRGVGSILKQYPATELAGVTLESRCLLEHLAALRHAAAAATDESLRVDVPDTQLERLHQLIDA